MKRGAKPTHAAEHEVRFEDARTDSWAAALERFASMLAQPPWAGARTRVVIADHWARYAIVPWVAALNSAEERLAHGRQLLTSLYGEAVAGWELCISEAPPQARRVAGAGPRGLPAGGAAAPAPPGSAPPLLPPPPVGP